LVHPKDLSIPACSSPISHIDEPACYRSLHQSRAGTIIVWTLGLTVLPATTDLTQFFDACVRSGTLWSTSGAFLGVRTAGRRDGDLRTPAGHP
jgi:hypothetical protein